MLREIGTWYFDWGYIITTILGGPIGYFSMRKSQSAFWLSMLGLLSIGIVMEIFKHS